MRIPLSQCSKNEKRMQQKCVAQSNKNITSGLQRLADVYDPPKSCDILLNAEFHGDCDGGTG